MKRMLDLFGCQGGACKGYQQAGFHVTSIDRDKQPRNPADVFVQADALEYLAEHWQEFDAFHASPPCQTHSNLKHFATPGKHIDLIPQTRDLLTATGRPYIIENVPNAPLIDPFILCGTMFLLRTDCGAELRRHRLFETNWDVGLIPCCQHAVSIGGTIGIFGDHARDSAKERHKYRPRTVIAVAGHQAQNSHRYSDVNKRCAVVTVTGSTPQQNVVYNTIRETFTVKQAGVAMGIDWMTMKGLAQAIPPAYTKWTGERLMEIL